MAKKKIVKHKKTPYLIPLANLECNNHWDFRDAVGLIRQRPDQFDNAFYLGGNDFTKTYGAFKTVWEIIKEALVEKKIQLVSGKLKGTSVNPLIDTPKEALILDRDSFLLWYSQNKDRIKQYLSYGDLSIHYEEFLDRLVKENVQINPPNRSPHPDTDKAIFNRLHEDYVDAVVKMLDKNPYLKWPDFKEAPNLKVLIRESGLSPKESTLQRKWIPEARTKVKVTGAPGAPKKK
tara:strand:- start:1671 stop:2372 length:702 start_codon:yes stop_codon:yes gene_type:complete